MEIPEKATKQGKNTNRIYPMLEKKILDHLQLKKNKKNKKVIPSLKCLTYKAGLKEAQ